MRFGRLHPEADEGGLRSAQSKRDLVAAAAVSTESDQATGEWQSTAD
ncbi:hypothetical protein [Amycolatopsis dendrobii]|uniref:Uncharacterized protein n=1 Tax=Amycolatopsis dendrobii TaxID=2760662 RepID=A0A7W3VZH0_9PSEU|nr:hypothetical protein [Amycolatopsis dendrobii]MBB1156066.1 hypothetical protein [Amycolatopsis dendrobii]